MTADEQAQFDLVVKQRDSAYEDGWEDGYKQGQKAGDARAKTLRTELAILRHALDEARGKLQ